MEVSLNHSRAAKTGYSSIQNDTPRDVKPTETLGVVGHHTGDSGSGTDEDADFELIVPTWRTWNFTRTLSYWIAILYLEGSVLFVIGGAFSMTELVGQDLRLEQGLVDGPYFAGGVCFGLGAYCGVLQVLNVHNKDSKRQLVWCGSCRQWSKAAKTVGKSAAAAYLTYFVGALLFQVGVGGGLVQNKQVSTCILLQFGINSVCLIGIVIIGAANACVDVHVALLPLALLYSAGRKWLTLGWTGSQRSQDQYAL